MKFVIKIKYLQLLKKVTAFQSSCLYYKIKLKLYFLIILHLFRFTRYDLQTFKVL